jgi:hypothetical protein
MVRGLHLVCRSLLRAAFDVRCLREVYRLCYQLLWVSCPMVSSDMSSLLSAVLNVIGFHTVHSVPYQLFRMYVSSILKLSAGLVLFVHLVNGF